MRFASLAAIHWRSFQQALGIVRGASSKNANPWAKFRDGQTDSHREDSWAFTATGGV